jgi:hypothetical protein
LEEEQLSEPDVARLMAQYRSNSGVSHRWPQLIRSTHPHTVSAQQNVSTVLNSHSNYASGILVTCRSQDQSGVGPTTFLPLDSIQILDERNTKVTSVLKDADLRDYVARSGDWASDAARSTPFYYIPHSMSLSALFTQGISAGGLKYSGRDRIDTVFSTTAASTNGGSVQLDVVTICPAWLEIKNGKASVHR